MPWKSAKQERWGNSASGKAKLGQEKIDEFNSASKGKRIPEEAPGEEMPPKSNRFTDLMKGVKPI